MKKLEANLIVKNLDGFVVQCIIVSLSIFDYCKVDLGTNLIISWKLPFFKAYDDEDFVHRGCTPRDPVSNDVCNTMATIPELGSVIFS